MKIYTAVITLQIIFSFNVLIAQNYETERNQTQYNPYYTTSYIQGYEDVVYLKNGYIVRGIILEHYPNQYIRIQENISGRVFTYQTHEIYSIGKEPAQNSSKNKTWMVQFGFGGPRSLGLLSLTKDFKLTNNIVFFLTGGVSFPTIGFGIAGSSDYNDDGINISVTYGTTGAGLPALNSSIYYQAKLSDNIFLTLGFMAGIWSYEQYYYDYYVDDWGYYQEGSHYEQVAVPYVLPMLSIDMRF